MPSRRKLVVTTLTLILATACTAPNTPTTAVPPTSETSGVPPTTSITATPSPSATAETTRLASSPVLAVKIDNTSPARPRIGLSAADVIYVEPVEGGLTRLLAIYSSRQPEAVGPIRSARESDAVLLANYGRVAFAFSGASEITLSAVRQGAQVNVSFDESQQGFRRETARPAPYNVIGSPATLLARAGGSVAAGDVGFQFGPAPTGGQAAAGVQTAYPAARLELRWDAGRSRYLVTTDGRAEVSDGQQVGAATVIVQTVRTHLSANRDVNGQPTPVLDLVGSGAVSVYRDGLRFAGTWRRGAAIEPTKLTGPDGTPLTLAAGPVWVLLVPTGQSVSSL